jgi:signal transduction histidine kinase
MIAHRLYGIGEFFFGIRAMDIEGLFKRYQELQAYVGWTEEDARRVHAVAEGIDAYLRALIEDFYVEIDRHPEARKVITGGPVQVERLKGTLLKWVRELFSGKYDNAYMARRWQVGLRHVEIGLNQIYTNVALSRIRSGLIRALEDSWHGDLKELMLTVRALNKLLDLDLAIIEDAYQAEYAARQQRTERLATIGQVAGGVAHELRNPLNVIKTSIYYLLNARNLTDEKKAEHLHRIEKQVLLADGVITALANFAKLPLPNLRPYSISQCIQETLENNPLPDTIQLRTVCPATLSSMLVDPDQIRIVLGNLIRNAREAMPQGGRLTISCREESDFLEIAVADTGTGIAPENMARILEPLYSTKARGLGLGLSMARAILEKNKGSLKVESQLGQGSTFTARLTKASPEGQ